MKDKMVTECEAVQFFTTESGRNVVPYRWISRLSTSPDDVLSADIGVLLLDGGGGGGGEGVSKRNGYQPLLSWHQQEGGSTGWSQQTGTVN